jgi:hypothetical protein
VKKRRIAAPRRKRSPAVVKRSRPVVAIAAADGNTITAVADATMVAEATVAAAPNAALARPRRKRLLPPPHQGNGRSGGKIRRKRAPKLITR